MMGSDSGFVPSPNGDPQQHLWEVDHPYYCNEGNFFNNDCHTQYKSWADFMSEWGDSDDDYNLVFRFDWREGDDWGAGAFSGDPNYRNGLLQICHMGQRKGLYTSQTVEVCRNDEPAVLSYLRRKWAYMQRLWAPVSSAAQTPDAVPQSEAKGSRRTLSTRTPGDLNE